MKLRGVIPSQNSTLDLILSSYKGTMNSVAIHHRGRERRKGLACHDILRDDVTMTEMDWNEDWGQFLDH